MKISASTFTMWFLLHVTRTTDAFTVKATSQCLLSPRKTISAQDIGYSRSRLVPCNVAASPPKTQPDASSSSSKSDVVVDWDERERKEMDWLIRVTSQFIGEGSPELGTMSRRLIRKGIEVMKAWSRRSSKPGSQAPHVVERILRRLVDEHDAGNDCFYIDTNIYNIVIHSWSMSDEDGAAQRAEDILTQMETMYSDDHNKRVRPNEDSYNGVIKAWVKSGRRHYAVAKAEAVMDRMHNLAETENGGKPLRPNRRGYNLLLYALANSMIDDADIKAVDILDKMEMLAADGNEDAKPDINSYNQVIASIARGRKSGFEYRAQEIFDRVMAQESDVEPDTDTFNAMLGCWLKSNDPNALQRIQQVWDTMDECYANGNSEAKPDQITFNTAISAYARQGDGESLKKAMGLRKTMEQQYNLQPDKISSNIVIDSWAKSGRRDAPERILEMLTAMEKDFIKGKKQMMPDSYTYSSVIDSFVRCGRPDAAVEAEKILQRMKDFHFKHGGEAPVQSVYNAVINAWAVHKNFKKSMERTHAILTEMELNPDICSPNRITYNTVLKACRNGRDERYAIMAEKLLNKMIHQSRNNPGLRPDCYTYTAVISAYGKSNSTQKAFKAFEFLQEMIASYKDGEVGVRPNTPTFNAALNACAFCIGESPREKEKIFTVMVTIMELLEEHVKPDVASYGTVLRGISNLLAVTDKRRDEYTQLYFEKCCQDGKVGDMVMKQLKFAASPQLYKSLIGKDARELVRLHQDLPSRWTCRARGPQHRKTN